MFTELTGQRMSVQAFRALPETNEAVIEHINGVVFVDSPVDPHQEVALNAALLVKALAPQGKTRVAPMDVYLGDDTVQPDVFWIAPESECVLLPDNRWQGPPDLVIEVLFPTTAQRDKEGGVKFQLYQQHGVREYWIIDPIYQSIEVFAQFNRLGEFWSGQTFQSPLLGTEVYPGIQDAC
jgi:Uma2 family endonuclease